jgi:hypothetical protein
MRHAPAVTFDVTQHGESVDITVTTTCPCGRGAPLAFPLGHLGAITVALTLAAGYLGIDLTDIEGHIAPFGSAAERQEFEERFKDAILKLREEASDAPDEGS